MSRRAIIPRPKDVREQLGILSEALQVHLDQMRKLDIYAIGGTIFPRYLDLLNTMLLSTKQRLNKLTQEKPPEENTDADSDDAQQMTNSSSSTPSPPSSPDTFSVPNTQSKPILAVPCYLLFEAATGFALFELLQEMKSVEEMEYFAQSFPHLREVLRLVDFEPFASQAEAVAAFLATTGGSSTPVESAYLEKFMHKHFPEGITLNFWDFESVHFQRLCLTSTSRSARPLYRGIREFFPNFIAGGDASACTTAREIEERLTLAQRGLAHQDGAEAPTSAGEIAHQSSAGIVCAGGSMTPPEIEKRLVRARRGLAHQTGVKTIRFPRICADFNVAQAISMLDEADSNIYVISSRMRDWYSIHFPELASLVYDDVSFAKIVKIIGDKRGNISQVPREKMAEIVDEETVEAIYKAARASIGDEILEIDLNAILKLTDKIIYLSEYREELRQYVHNTMKKIAPTLHILVGELGARVIAHAGSLRWLAVMPASTIQLMGAEKALFRARRTGGNTPKHGYIFHSPFVQMASAQDRGKVARTLANKIAIAARIDHFSDEKTEAFGQKLHDQMTKKLEFINNPKRNFTAMKEEAEEGEEARKRRRDGDEREGRGVRKEGGGRRDVSVFSF
eukprot:Phypoly_transcript_04951.p1 GENE.Phypoly_transcript_04951~~Phypoly_transcript_04951.p1  ORF type:complete len:622 (+),score=122.82 Phypoly_transcript_04951:162-2027(+)